MIATDDTFKMAPGPLGEGVAGDIKSVFFITLYCG